VFRLPPALFASDVLVVIFSFGHISSLPSSRFFGSFLPLSVFPPDLGSWLECSVFANWLVCRLGVGWGTFFPLSLLSSFTGVFSGTGNPFLLGPVYFCRWFPSFRVLQNFFRFFVAPVFCASRDWCLNIPRFLQCLMDCPGCGFYFFSWFRFVILVFCWTFFLAILVYEGRRLPIFPPDKEKSLRPGCSVHVFSVGRAYLFGFPSPCSGYAGVFCLLLMLPFRAFRPFFFLNVTRPGGSRFPLEAGSPLLSPLNLLFISESFPG